MPHSRSHNHIRLRRGQTFPPASPALHPQNNHTYRDPFPQANPDSPPAHPHSAVLQLCPSTENLGKWVRTSESLPPHNRLLLFYKHHKIIRVIWLKAKELFIRNNPWIRYTLNLLTSLWSTGIHKLLVTNLQKIHSIGPKIQIKSLENKSFFENY